MWQFAKDLDYGRAWYCDAYRLHSSNEIVEGPFTPSVVDVEPFTPLSSITLWEPRRRAAGGRGGGNGGDRGHRSAPPLAAGPSSSGGTGESLDASQLPVLDDPLDAAPMMGVSHSSASSADGSVESIVADEDEEVQDSDVVASDACYIIRANSPTLTIQLPLVTRLEHVT